MNENAGTNEKDWKHKLADEIREYLLNFLYLAVFFGAFTWYRRLVLAEYHITYLHYGIAIIQSLVLAKVVMIGELVYLGRRFEDKPLIIPTLHKTVVFTIWVAVFAILEHTIDGLMHDNGLKQSFSRAFTAGKDELTARCLVVFLAFIPFFALKEVRRVLGEKKMRTLFMGPAEKEQKIRKTDF
jgi:hypothetical protein